MPPSDGAHIPPTSRHGPISRAASLTVTCGSSPVVRATRPPREHGEARPGCHTSSSGPISAGRHDRRQRPVSRQHPPQRRHGGRAGLFYEDRLFGTWPTWPITSTSGGAPREHRSVPRDLPGGRPDPAGEAGSAHEIVDDTFRLILAQIRSKRETAGDFRAQLPPTLRGATTGRAARPGPGHRRPDDRRPRRLHSPLDRVRDRAAPTGDVSRRVLPRQRWLHRRTRPSRSRRDGLRRRHRIRPAGSDPQRPAPVNASFGPIYSACAYALKALIDPALPVIMASMSSSA